MKKKLGRILVVLLSVAMCMQLMVPLASPIASAANRSVTINIGTRRQTMEGWGTSLGWWGNMVGGWTQPGQYDVNKSRRDELIDMFFSDEGLGLNILRYNIGGGDDPSPSHAHRSRLEGQMPVFKASATADYDWTQDANQVYTMKKAIADRAESRTNRGLSTDVITELFSNSPPWWLTVSKCTSGHTSSNSDNIDKDDMPAFAQYLADVAHHFVNDEKIKVDYLVPLNEANVTYWTPSQNGTKQEGCRIAVASSSTSNTGQNALFNAMRNVTLPAGTQLSGLDETSPSASSTSWGRLNNDNKNAISKFNTHTYDNPSDSSRTSLRSTIPSSKKLWMDEVCVSSGDYAPTSMATPIMLSGRIVSDLKNLQASAWVYWQAVENLLECTLYNGNWGLVTAAYYEPYGTPGNRWTQTATGNNFSKYNLSWDGSVGTKVNVGDYWIGKNYYALGQYSKFIRKGYTIVDSTLTTTANTNTQHVAAISPDGRELVIVATNANSSSDNLTFTLNGAINANLSRAEVYRTSSSQNLARLSDITSFTSDNKFTYAMPAQSVTTFVIKSNDIIQGTAASHPTNKTALNTRIAALQSTAQGTMPGSTYSNVTWAPFQEARRIANLVSDERGASQADVDAALAALNSTNTALTIAVSDKTALNAEITRAKAITRGYFTDASWDFLQIMISIAESVSADPGVIQSEVNETLTTLSNAISGLTLKPVEWGVLNEAIAAYDALTDTDWSPASWAGLAGYYTAATNMNGDLTAAQGDVNTTAASLMTAIGTLTVDKIALANAIASYTPLIETDYSPASWSSMKTAYDAAVDVNDDNTAKQSAINTATTNLLGAVAALTVDKTALANAIDSYDLLTEADYSPTSWSSVTSVYDAAEIGRAHV